MAQSGALNREATVKHSREGVARLVPPVVGGLLLLFSLIGLIGSAIRDPRPHDIPVGLVGPPAAAQQMSTAFGSAAPGAFQFTSYASEADARAALDARSVDGFLVIGPSPRLVLAGAAGDASTGVMTAAFTNAIKAQGATLTVETVHPFATGDAHGLILFFVVVAVIVSALVSQALVFATANDAGFGAQLVVVVAFSVLAGLVGMGTATWLAGDYGSGFWTAAGLVMLGAAAVGAVVAGLVRLFGPPGLALAALIVVLLDLVTSGGPVGSQLLPDFYRWLAPWMPAGQLYSSLRSALYFDGAALGTPLALMAAWLVGGIVLMGLGEVAHSRRRAGVAPSA